MNDNENHSKWNAEQVQSVLMNPFHTMGPSPTVDDATWVTAQTKLVKELGPERYFAAFLALLKERAVPSCDT